jgi:hypothetical protein
LHESTGLGIAEVYPIENAVATGKNESQIAETSSKRIQFLCFDDIVNRQIDDLTID